MQLALASLSALAAETKRRKPPIDFFNRKDSTKGFFGSTNSLIFYRRSCTETSKSTEGSELRDLMHLPSELLKIFLSLLFCQN